MATSPSWARRQEPTSLGALLEWLHRVAAPHLAVLAPDRCIVFHGANTGMTLTGVPDAAKVQAAAILLWDETARACDWLADHGYHDAPTRRPRTADPDEAYSQYRVVEQYIELKMQASKPATEEKKRGGGRRPSAVIARRNERILADFAKGLSVNAIVDKYDVSPSNARTIKCQGNKAKNNPPENRQS